MRYDPNRPMLRNIMEKHRGGVIHILHQHIRQLSDKSKNCLSDRGLRPPSVALKKSSPCCLLSKTMTTCAYGTQSLLVILLEGLSPSASYPRDERLARAIRCPLEEVYSTCIYTFSKGLSSNKLKLLRHHTGR